MPVLQHKPVCKATNSPAQHTHAFLHHFEQMPCTGTRPTVHTSYSLQEMKITPCLTSSTGNPELSYRP
jgi:hypothetical protein